jgi:tellurite resistance protein
MSARSATMTVLAKMALSDGTVTEEERLFLQQLLPGGGSVDELLEEARRTPLAELVDEIDSYADRFFVALRAASVAAIDAEVDVREEALYDELVEELQIEFEDRALIARSVEALRATPPGPVEPRVEELFRRSSFFQS